MENTKMIYGVVGFLAGALIVGVIAFGMNRTVETHSDANMHRTMDGMTQGLEGKTGDAFDKAFIEEMITHHEGAVVMAQMALTNAKHDEIKTMANAIISAQTSEIAQMKEWLTSWY
jgi:uncharacterized protein (DUF305 family)